MPQGCRGRESYPCLVLANVSRDPSLGLRSSCLCCPPVAVVRKRKCTRERGVVSNGLQVCKSDSVSFAVKPRARLVVAILRAQLVVAILAGREGNGERLCSTAQGEY